MTIGRLIAAVAMLAAFTAGCGDDDDATGSVEGAELVGVFAIDQGQCADDISGSHFRMVQPGGTVADGPFVTNGDSPCPDKTWTPVAPGDDGGLRTGAYQPQPAAPFDEAGNATSTAITQPQKWFAVSFALATNQRDPQTDRDVPAPRILVEDGTLTGELAAFAAAWNGQHFNQGAPKPDGSLPGETATPTGTYDESTGAYTLDWTSQIVGGPFNSFTGVWHLEGVFHEEEQP